MPVLVRITTVPLSLDKLLTGQLKFMKRSGFDVVAVSSSGSEVEAVKEREECDFYVVEMTRTITPFKDLVSLYNLVKLLKKLKPDIVHTHTPKAGLIGMMAAWFCKVPVRLHTVAGLPLMEASGLKKKVLIEVEKLTYKYAHFVYPNSFELKNYIEENRFTTNKKLKVIANGTSNGIDVDYFKISDEILQKSNELKAQFQIENNTLVFIFIGRIVKDKGINELVNAFDNLNAKYPEIKLLLIGPFEDELDPIEAGTRKIISTNKNIITTGFINDVRPYLALSHVLAFPSYREGFPNVPLQAGCFQLSLILSDINGCNEIVNDGVNGLLVPAKSTTALLNAMHTIISNKQLREKFAKASRETIVNKYSCEIVWKALLEEYLNLLHKKEIYINHVQQNSETFA